MDNKNIIFAAHRSKGGGEFIIYRNTFVKYSGISVNTLKEVPQIETNYSSDLLESIAAFFRTLENKSPPSADTIRMDLAESSLFANEYKIPAIYQYNLMHIADYSDKKIRKFAIKNIDKIAEVDLFDAVVLLYTSSTIAAERKNRIADCLQLGEYQNSALVKKFAAHLYSTYCRDIRNEVLSIIFSGDQLCKFAKMIVVVYNIFAAKVEEGEMIRPFLIKRATETGIKAEKDMILFSLK